MFIYHGPLAPTLNFTSDCSVLVWLDCHDQHALALHSCYSLDHIDLSATARSLSLSACNEVCVCSGLFIAQFLYPIMVFLSHCAAAITSNHSGFDRRLNARINACKFSQFCVFYVSAQMPILSSWTVKQMLRCQGWLELQSTWCPSVHFLFGSGFVFVLH